MGHGISTMVGKAGILSVVCLFLLLEKMNMEITVICRYNLYAYIYNNEDIFQKKQRQLIQQWCKSCPVAKVTTQSHVLSWHALLCFPFSLSLSFSPHPSFLIHDVFPALFSYRAFGCLSSSDRASSCTFWQAIHSKSQSPWRWLPHIGEWTWIL